MTDTQRPGTALITGASTGIGAVYADRLAKRGYDLILIARGADRLESLSERLRRATGRAVRSMRADLGDKADLVRVEAELKNNPDVSMLVNNAGVASVSPLLSADVDQMQRMIELNTVALTRLTYAAAPAFVSRQRGTMINIASIVGISPEMLNGVYGATKAFVIALTHSLQHELAGKGLRIQAVLPGATATDLWENAGLPWQKLPSSIVMSAEDMVDAALTGLDQGELVTIPSLQNGEDWTQFEAARKSLAQRFGNSQPGLRYRTAQKVA